MSLPCLLCGSGSPLAASEAHSHPAVPRSFFHTISYHTIFFVIRTNVWSIPAHVMGWGPCCHFTCCLYQAFLTQGICRSGSPPLKLLGEDLESIFCKPPRKCSIPVSASPKWLGRPGVLKWAKPPPPLRWCASYFFSRQNQPLFSSLRQFVLAMNSTFWLDRFFFQVQAPTHAHHPTWLSNRFYWFF